MESYRPQAALAQLGQVTLGRNFLRLSLLHPPPSLLRTSVPVSLFGLQQWERRFKFLQRSAARFSRSFPRCIPYHFRAGAAFHTLTARSRADLHAPVSRRRSRRSSILKHVLRLPHKVRVDLRPEQNGQSRKKSGISICQTWPQSGRAEES